ncbi:MAG: hypothetical protein JW839_20270 [Candidatus Lokiarchaeota archaeon]|nr:hypothetical protein [Candidatus Lokiarchaeota archaeon]
MDEPGKAPTGEDAAKLTRPAISLPPAEKGQPVSSYITRLQLPGGAIGEKGASTLQELAFVKGLTKILGFYSTLAVSEVAEGSKNLVYHGNVLVDKGHHGIDVSTKALQLAGASKEMLIFEVDMDRILVDFKEFALAMDDFFDYLRINVPSIVFLHNADTFLARSFKVKESSSASSFIIRFTRFIVEREFLRDKLVLVIVTDNPHAVDRRFLNTVDFTVDVDMPTRDERELYLKHLLSPEGPVDFSLVSSEMDGWTWGDIEGFAKHAMLQKQTKELKDVSAKFLLDAIHGENDLDEYIPPSSRFTAPKGNQRGDEPTTRAPVQPQAPGPGSIQSSPVSGVQRVVDDPFKEVLWESAADRDYDAIARAIEHMEKGVFMQEDRACLARYPFLLHDDLLTAKRKLDAAKNKIDVIKKHFRAKTP